MERGFLKKAHDAAAGAGQEIKTNKGTILATTVIVGLLGVPLLGSALFYAFAGALGAATIKGVEGAAKGFKNGGPSV